MIFNGVLDLHYKAGHLGRSETKYLGGDCSALPSACNDASPITHVHSGAPAFYVGHGTADQTVPFAQAEAFTSALRNAKVPVEFYIATDGPHTYWAKHRYFDDNLKNVIQFLSGSLAKNPHTRTVTLHLKKTMPE